MSLRRLALLAGLLALVVVARAPASLLADRLREASGGRLVLVSPAGTVWSGSGDLWWFDPASQSGSPWLPLRWRFAWGRLLAGEAGIDLDTGGRPLARVFADLRGFGVRDADVSAPAAFALATIPGPLGRAGWRGDLRVRTAAWRCRWAAADDCTGRAELAWHGAAATLLPWPELGHYVLTADAAGRQGRLALQTTAGALRVDGDGGWDEGGAIHFAATLRGDPVLLSRLPGIAGDHAFATADPGTYRLVLGSGAR